MRWAFQNSFEIKKNIVCVKQKVSNFIIWQGAAGKWVVYFSVGFNCWIPLKNLPADIGENHDSQLLESVSYFSGRIFHRCDSDRQSDRWAARPFFVPTGHAPVREIGDFKVSLGTNPLLTAFLKTFVNGPVSKRSSAPLSRSLNHGWNVGLRAGVLGVRCL